MQDPRFEHAIDQILRQDERYEREAYFFLREVLDYTLKKNSEAREKHQHVSGNELLEGFRHCALEQFGPMVPTVLQSWNIHRCEDIGAMVFNLVEAGVFGKNEDDSMEDFSNQYSFEEAFVTPFLPRKTSSSTSPPSNTE